MGKKIFTLLTLVLFLVPTSVLADNAFGYFTTNDGKTVRITGMENRNRGDAFSYAYGADGRVATCTSGELTYKFSYSPFNIVHDVASGEYKHIEISNVKTNSNGYITSYDLTQVWDMGDGLENYKLKCTADYDVDGHLVKLVSDGTVEYAEDGETEPLTSTYTYTWDNGRISEIGYTLVFDGENEVDTKTYNYDNGVANATGQWTYNYLYDMNDISESFGEGATEYLFYLGYFGKGSNMHPTSVTEVDADYGDAPDTDISYFDTQLNADGTVYRTGKKEETYNDFSYYVFSYEEATTGISNVKADKTDADKPEYSLSGQRVGKNHKGLTIKKGRKFIVK